MSSLTRTLVRSGCILAASLGATLGAPAARDAGASPAAQPLQTPSCGVWTADYLLAARLRLDDTPFGAGNGTYEIGPGHLRLRFSKIADATATKVELLAYDMRERFIVESSVLFFHAKVTTATDTRATPDESGVIASGILRDRELVWSTKVHGYRTDGTTECNGSGCGMSGAPASGIHPLHIAPHAVQFSSFTFDSPSLSTLKMPEAKVSHTDTPRQTAFITFSGRQTSNRCAGAE